MLNRFSRSLACLFLSTPVFLQSAPNILVEAESFSEPGGWELDTQFIDIMGSPYLLAHGLGTPVKPAETIVQAAEAGQYKTWVRTKDWVAPWKAPGTPGRFKLAVNGKEVPADFGTAGADWHWQDGGTVELKQGENKLALLDQTGFDGRCDAILFSKDPAFQPPNQEPALHAFRRQTLGLAPKPVEKDYDLVVVGGGYAGTAAALSAARQGLKVALVQNRPVLGGNGSSEVRVWAMGGTMRGKYPHLGEIVEEFTDHAPDSPGLAEHYGDAKKEAVVRAEKHIDLYLNHHALSVAMGENKAKIASVTALNTRTSEEVLLRGKFFSDCTGHGTLGALAQAQFRMLETGHLGMSNMWYIGKASGPVDWPATPWALPLETADFPPLKQSSGKLASAPFWKGEWFWESGFDKHPILGLESMRDWNLRAVFGAFTALKAGPEAEKHKDSQLQWVAYVGGPRESRLLTGDLILSQEDIVSKKEFPDGTVPTTWDLDLHYPKEQYAKKFPDDPFISRAAFGKGVDKNLGYPIPYRCFYSANILNLFMAGRNISVDHNALGTTRVMRTCGMMGEVVGKAAYLCVKEKTDPRGVYHSHLDKLLAMCQQPGAMRRDALDAELYLPAGAVIPPKQVLKPEAETSAHKGIDPKTLPGIIIDNSDPRAKLTGSWRTGDGLEGFVGANYAYIDSKAKPEARYEFTVPKEGDYEVLVSYGPHENRSARVMFAITGSSTDKTTEINQKEKPAESGIFRSLGIHRFVPGKPASVTVTPGDAAGNLCVDAVQLLQK